MSKAFTSEETVDDPIIVRARAPLPAGETNYVTERGLSLLRAELGELETERGRVESAVEETQRVRLPPLTARIGELASRIGSAVLVDIRTQPSDEVRFGAIVTVRDGVSHLRRYQIVGVDEANAKEGRVAFVSPLARALLGRRVGEVALVQTPRGDEELEVVAISYQST
jgi:transcription elongation factor GreB